MQITNHFLTFIRTDSLSFSLLTIFMATFWHVTQWTPSFTRPGNQTQKKLVNPANRVIFFKACLARTWGTWDTPKYLMCTLKADAMARGTNQKNHGSELMKWHSRLHLLSPLDTQIKSWTAEWQRALQTTAQAAHRGTGSTNSHNRAAPAAHYAKTEKQNLLYFTHSHFLIHFSTMWENFKNNFIAL